MINMIFPCCNGGTLYQWLMYGLPTHCRPKAAMRGSGIWSVTLTLKCSRIFRSLTQNCLRGRRRACKSGRGPSALLISERFIISPPQPLYPLQNGQRDEIIRLHRIHQRTAPHPAGADHLSGQCGVNGQDGGESSSRTNPA